MDKLKIGIDMDETINTFIHDLIEKYNDRYDDILTFNEVFDYNIRKFLKPECKDIFAEFCDNEFMSNLKLVAGAKNVIDKLHETEDIYFVTAGYPETVFARHKWLKRHFEWYNHGNLIICTNKQMLKLDVLIDDHYDNLINGCYRSILIDKPWNRKYNTIRAYNWFEVPQKINEAKNISRKDDEE